MNDTLSHMNRAQSNPKVLLEKEKFEHYLKKVGLRLTPGRKRVFETAMSSHGHFAAEEVAKTCRHKGIRVSRATVYRSLHEMLEAGVVRETAFGEKHHHFEHLYDERPHHHARCVRCSKMIEFPDMKEDNVYVPYLKNQGFQILGHEMHFYGLCKECSKLPK